MSFFHSILYKLYRQINPINKEYIKIKENPIESANKYLNSLLSYTVRNIEFYKNFPPELNRFSILTKQIIKENFNKLHLLELPRDAYFNTSGGSTGEPVKIIQDSVYDKYIGYTIKYFHEEFLHLPRKFIKKVYLWGSERDILNWFGDWKKKIKGYITGIKYFNAFYITPEKLENIVKYLNKHKPSYIRGYASTLYEVARYIRSKGIKINFRPIVIISSAETLQQFMRKEIEDIFQCKVYDFYGSRESGAIAGECPYGNFHFFIFNQWVELLPYHKNIKKILVTTLHNFTMPLIRYDIGDLCEVSSSDRCPCGNPLPFVKRIVGRITDNFLKRDGTVVHGEYFTHLFYFKKIDKFQVIQEDYDKITINIFSKNNISEKLIDEIIKNIKKVMGKYVKININFLRTATLTPQGKFIYTYSKVYRKL